MEVEQLKNILLITDDYYASGEVQRNLSNFQSHVVTIEGAVNLEQPNVQQLLLIFDLIILQVSKASRLEHVNWNGYLQTSLPVIVLNSDYTNEYPAHIPLDIKVVQYPLPVKQLVKIVDSLLEGEQRSETMRSTQFDTLDIAPQQVYRAFERAPGTNQSNKRVLALNEKVMYIDDTLVYLSQKEERLMKLLLDAEYNPVSSKDVYEKIWEETYDRSKQPYVSNIVKKLRAKVRHCLNEEVNLILNQKKQGYYLNNRFEGVKNYQMA